jgi:hypothetical protein
VSAPRGAAGGGQDDILVEFVVYGRTVKVTAIHAASGTEACIMGPAGAPRAVLEALAARKLAAVMARKA